MRCQVEVCCWQKQKLAVRNTESGSKVLANGKAQTNLESESFFS